MGDSLQKIIRKTGRKPTGCRCQSCKNQCHTPCLGTPEDIQRLIEAGYGDKLKPTLWLVGMAIGRLNYPIAMVQAAIEDDGWCVFRQDDGLCSLHDKGLKPTEGRLSHHSIKAENYSFSKGLSYNVAKEWLESKNDDLIAEIMNLYTKKDGDVK